MSEAKGFSLLEVLVVVTIIGLIATLSLPSLIRSMDRSRQSATLSDLQVIGSGLERYAVEHGSYPVVPNMSALRAELEPDYVKRVPLRDGWGHPLVLETDEQGSTYTLTSPGKDGELQRAALEEVTRDFAADIVYVDGVFVQRPASRRDGGDNDENPSPDSGGEALGEADPDSS